MGKSSKKRTYNNEGGIGMDKGSEKQVNEMMELLDEMAGELLKKIQAHTERGEALPALQASLLFEHVQNLIILLSCYKEFGRVPERFRSHTIEDISAHIDDIIERFNKPSKPKKMLGVALSDETSAKN
jgi:hypothetical protein